MGRNIQKMELSSNIISYSILITVGLTKCKAEVIDSYLKRKCFFNFIIEGIT